MIERTLLNQPVALYVQEYDAANVPTLPTVEQLVPVEPGSGAAATAAIAGGAVTAVAITAGGSGYHVPPLVVFAGGNGADAAATATVANGVVTGVVITAGGMGYTAVPVVSFVAQEDLWTSVGKSPDIADLYGTDGVTMRKPNEVQLYEGSKSLGPVGAYRTKDGLMLECMLYDNRIEMDALALDQEITEVAAASGTIGTKSIGLSRPGAVKGYRLLARGISPADPSYVRQYYCPHVKVTSGWEPKFSVKNLTGFQMTFTALVDNTIADVTRRLGHYIEQSADALP